MTLNYTLRQVESFVAVAESGSIARAAGLLGLSPSAVTSSLNELERAWGVQLTTRRRARGVDLTPSGAHALVDARNLLNLAVNTQRDLRSEGRQLTGRVRIGSYVSLAPTMLVNLMSSFATAHPGVELDFLADAQDAICAEVLAGQMDLALTYDLSVPPGLDRVFLRDAVPLAVLPPDHPLAGRPSVGLAELTGDPMILLDISPSRENTLAMFRDAGVQPRIAYRTTDFEVTRSLVARGLGYSILVQRPYGDVSYSGLPLAVRPIDPPVNPLPVILVSNPLLRPTPPALALMELAREQLGGA
jgi:DNA-binding transcriptional LysR family regulator